MSQATEPMDDTRTLDHLDAKALTTPMSVLSDAPGVQDAEDMWLVFHQIEHVVALVGGEFTCDCKGHHYGHKCYHIRRVEFATGCRSIPAWTDRDQIDDQLGAHVDGGPVFEAEPAGDRDE